MEPSDPKQNINTSNSQTEQNSQSPANPSVITPQPQTNFTPPPKKSHKLLVVILVCLGVFVLLLIILAVALSAGSFVTKRLNNTTTQQLTYVPFESECYKVDVPSYYIANKGKSKSCYGQIDLWGEFDSQGKFIPAPGGIIGGEIKIQPIPVTASQQYSSSNNINETVDKLANDYIPKLGTVVTLKQPVKLDGASANLTLLKSAKETTKYRALLTTYAPKEYTVDSTEKVRLFLIVLSTPEDNGQQIIDKIISSWKWK